MANDPRTFLVANCPKGKRSKEALAKNKQSHTSSSNKDKNVLGKIFDVVGAAGDLEILNDVGAGKVGEGIRALTKVSNLKRVKGTAGAADTRIDANDVFSSVEISQGGIEQARVFNPGTVNRATGAAKAIADKVNAGNFDISSSIDLIADISDLATTIGSIFNKTPQAAAREVAKCSATPFARAISGTLAPKSKFMFFMEIFPNSAYDNNFKPSDVSTNQSDATGAKETKFESQKSTAHQVKIASRPNVQFEYDDVNYYNYRTKAPKHTIFQPATVTFYDDMENGAHDFFENYMKILSPIMNNGSGIAPYYEINGLLFTNGSSASFGPQANTKNVIDRILIHHFHHYGNALTTYEYINPKFTEIQLGDLDMTTSEPCEIQITFSYDSVFIEDYSIGKEGSLWNEDNIYTKTELGGYGIDQTHGPKTETNGTGSGGKQSTFGKALGILSDPAGAIDSVKQKVIAKGTSVVKDKALSAVTNSAIGQKLPGGILTKIT